MEGESWEEAFMLIIFLSLAGIMTGYSFPEFITSIFIAKFPYFSSENVSVGAFYLALTELWLKKY